MSTGDERAPYMTGWQSLPTAGLPPAKNSAEVLIPLGFFYVIG